MGDVRDPKWAASSQRGPLVSGHPYRTASIFIQMRDERGLGRGVGPHKVHRASFERSGEKFLVSGGTPTVHGALSAHELFKCTLPYPPLDIPPQCHSSHISGLNYPPPLSTNYISLRPKRDGREGR